MAEYRQEAPIDLSNVMYSLKGTEDLREIAYLRLENPDMSLRDLGQNLSTPISRSGANHRMQRLLEYAGTEVKTNGK